MVLPTKQRTDANKFTNVLQFFMTCVRIFVPSATTFCRFNFPSWSCQVKTFGKSHQAAITCGIVVLHTIWSENIAPQCCTILSRFVEIFRSNFHSPLASDFTGVPVALPEFNFVLTDAPVFISEIFLPPCVRVKWMWIFSFPYSFLRCHVLSVYVLCLLLVYMTALHLKVVNMRGLFKKYADQGHKNVLYLEVTCLGLLQNTLLPNAYTYLNGVSSSWKSPGTLLLWWLSAPSSHLP